MSKSRAAASKSNSKQQPPTMSNVYSSAVMDRASGTLLTLQLQYKADDDYCSLSVAVHKDEYQHV
jgi:hypothetical protein